MSMHYDDRPAIDELYRTIARLSSAPADPEAAMAISAGLVELGEERSWASVWYAFGAIHYDLSEEAGDRALELLAHVDRSDEARAAALMLTAEIEKSSGIWYKRPVDRERQVDLLAQAVALAPGWPDLHGRLAIALVEVGRREEARPHAEAAVAGIVDDPSSTDPFDDLVTGAAFVRSFVAEDMAKLLDERAEGA